MIRENSLKDKGTDSGIAYDAPNMYHDNRDKLFAHQTLLSNMYHDNIGRLSVNHTLLPNMYHDNRGRLSAHHTLLSNMYHDNRGRLSAHHTLLSNMQHDKGNTDCCNNDCRLFYSQEKLCGTWYVIHSG